MGQPVSVTAAAMASSAVSKASWSVPAVTWQTEGRPVGTGHRRGGAGGPRNAVGAGLVVQAQGGDGFAARWGDLVGGAVDVARVDPPRLADAAGTGEDVVVEHGPGQQPRTGRGVGDRVSADADPGSGPGGGGA